MNKAGNRPGFNLWGIVMSYESDRNKEKANVRRLIRAALANGWTVSVNDGEEWTIRKSRDSKEIFAALFTTDSDIVRFRDSEGKSIGTIYCIYGNEPESVVSDYSSPNLDAFGAFIEPITENFLTSDSLFWQAC